MTENAKQENLFGGGEERSAPPFDVCLLGLGSVKGLGLKGLRAIAAYLDGHIENVWRLGPEELHHVLYSARVPDASNLTSKVMCEVDDLLARGEKASRELQHQGVRLIPRRELPAKVQNAPDPPEWLFFEGDLNALYSPPHVTVVGTRNPSERGRIATQTTIKLLAAYNMTIVSGLAQGIDAEAHRTALEYDLKNVAFLGTGIDVVFPRETSDLRNDIVRKGGVLATEYLPGTKYGRENFIKRNRLQASLADLVIPVEAQLRSGTAHTIRFARALNRPIIGLRWKGSNGIHSDLRSQGVPVFDIFTPDAWRDLDGIFRQLAEDYGHDTFGLRLVERRLESEARSRRVRSEDFEKLRALIDRLESEAAS